MPRTLVLGGGISGLSTAYFLARADPDLDILLLEAGSRLGGTLGSEQSDGFVLERGPNGFLDNVPDTLGLVRDLALEPRLLKASAAAKRRYIYKGGRLIALPSSPLAFVRSPLLSVRGRLRLLSEPLRRPGDGSDESVASFGRRRLGEEATRLLLDPLVSGIYAGDVERLSLPGAFPRMAEMEARHGSLFRAMIQARRERSRRAQASAQLSGAEDAAAARAGDEDAAPPAPPMGSTLCSFTEGMQELVTALEASLGPRVRRGWPASQVLSEGKRFMVLGPGGAREIADSVVLAVPAYRAASLVHAASPELSVSLEAIPYSPIAVVCLGFARESIGHPLDGFGFLAPRDQGLRLLGAIWVSSIYPSHAPPGRVSLRCMLGGSRDPDSIDRSDEALVALVLDELRPILSITGEPTLQRVYRYTKGIPQYNIGHNRRIEAIERQLWPLPGLFLTGNAYRGVGVNDCVREARRKARAVIEHLRK